MRAECREKDSARTGGVFLLLVCFGWLVRVCSFAGLNFKYKSNACNAKVLLCCSKCAGADAKPGGSRCTPRLLALFNESRALLVSDLLRSESSHNQCSRSSMPALLAPVLGRVFLFDPALLTGGGLLPLLYTVPYGCYAPFTHESLADMYSKSHARGLATSFFIWSPPLYPGCHLTATQKESAHHPT